MPKTATPNEPTAMAEARRERHLASNVALVEKAFPEKGGFRRKINLLWDCQPSLFLSRTAFYRVNFHDPANDNKIADSHFVCIVDGEVVERGE